MRPGQRAHSQCQALSSTCDGRTLGWTATPLVGHFCNILILVLLLSLPCLCPCIRRPPATRGHFSPNRRWLLVAGTTVPLKMSFSAYTLINWVNELHNCRQDCLYLKDVFSTCSAETESTESLSVALRHVRLLRYKTQHSTWSWAVKRVGVSEACRLLTPRWARKVRSAVLFDLRFGQVSQRTF